MLERLRAAFSRPKSASQTAEGPCPAGALASAPVEAGDAHSYSPDHPISRPEEDRFDRWPFAQRIAETLATRADPSSLVVGIYGPWGDGKTSVLGLMETALVKHPGVVPVRFNPWFFASQEKLLKGFFETLTDALGKRLSTRAEQVGQLLKRYGGLLSIASVGISANAVRISPGDAAKNLGESLSAVELSTLRARVERLLKDAAVRVVIMIDDIDRLDRDDIHAIFKLVKLSAGFEHISYVLAFDDEVVAGSLGSRYGTGDSAAGRSFLEKIIQVPLHLPPADAIALRRIAFDGVNAALNASGIDLSREDSEAFARYFVDGLEPKLSTPRQAKLFVNAITFALPLLKGEVNASDQMLLEGIRVLYPRLYATIRDHPSLFLGSARDDREDAQAGAVNALIDEALDDLTPGDRTQVRERLLEHLFPRLGNSGYGRDWDPVWARDMRIASGDFFPRYFAYSVPAGDVSEQKVEEFIALAASGSLAETRQLLESVASKGGTTKLIRKLRDRETKIDPAAAPALADAILRNGALYPRESGGFVPDWTFLQVAILAAALLKRIADKDVRREEALRLMTLTEPLGLAVHFLRWCTKDEKAPEQDRLLTEDAEKALGAALVERIARAAAAAPLHQAFPEDTQSLLWYWRLYGDSADVTRHMTGSLTTPEEVLSFIGRFTGTAWSMETGLSVRCDFRRNSYDAIVEHVDGEWLLARLKERYGDALNAPQYHHDDAVPDAEVLAHQFAYVHQGAAAGESPDKDE